MVQRDQISEVVQEQNMASAKRGVKTKSVDSGYTMETVSYGGNEAFSSSRHNSNDSGWQGDSSSIETSAKQVESYSSSTATPELQISMDDSTSEKLRDIATKPDPRVGIVMSFKTVPNTPFIDNCSTNLTLLNGTLHTSKEDQELNSKCSFVDDTEDLEGRVTPKNYKRRSCWYIKALFLCIFLMALMCCGIVFLYHKFYASKTNDYQSAPELGRITGKEEASNGIKRPFTNHNFSGRIYAQFSFQQSSNINELVTLNCDIGSETANHATCNGKTGGVRISKSGTFMVYANIMMVGELDGDKKDTPEDNDVIYLNVKKKIENPASQHQASKVTRTPMSRIHDAKSQTIIYSTTLTYIVPFLQRGDELVLSLSGVPSGVYLSVKNSYMGIYQIASAT